MGAPPVIRVSGRSSQVAVHAVRPPDSGVEVDGARLERLPDGTFEVSHPTSRIDVRCPVGSSLTISVASGRVSVRGAAGSVRVISASGRVEVDEAVDLEVRSSSGRVEVGRCRDSCRVSTQSGRIDIGVSGAAELSSVSGRVKVGRADHAKVRTVTGRIQIEVSPTATTHVTSVSGRIEVRVAGSSPMRSSLTTVTGHIERKVPEGDGGAQIEASSVSGAISVERP